jgi:hypothetical protein
MNYAVISNFKVFKNLADRITGMPINSKDDCICICEKIHSKTFMWVFKHRTSHNNVIPHR